MPCKHGHGEWADGCFERWKEEHLVDNEHRFQDVESGRTFIGVSISFDWQFGWYEAYGPINDYMVLCLGPLRIIFEEF